MRARNLVWIEVSVCVVSVCVFGLRVGDVFFHLSKYISSTCEEPVFLVPGMQSEGEMNIFDLVEFTFFGRKGDNKQTKENEYNLWDVRWQSVLWGRIKQGRGEDYCWRRCKPLRRGLGCEGRTSLLASAGSGT